MSGGNQMLLDQIKEAIENGTLTQEEIERRLKAAIETEFVQQGHPADSEFLNLCLDLLGQIQTGGHYEYVSHMEESKAAVTEKYQRYMRAKRIRGVATRVATVAAIVILLVGVVFQKSWFSGHSTPDEQQYVIQGHTISAGTNGIADNNSDESTDIFTTSDIQLAYSRSHLAPNVPADPGFTYDNVEYTVITSNPYYIFSVVYTDNDHNIILRYNVKQYRNTSSYDVQLAFEQDKSGEDIMLLSKIPAYSTENIGRYQIVWLDKDSVYTVESLASIDFSRQYAEKVCKEVENK